MSVTIVCPLNGHSSSERALTSAFDAARSFAGSVELFSAVEDAHMVSRRQDYLETVAADHGCPRDQRLTIEVVVDPHAPRAIAERSALPDAITVMATSSQPLMHTGYLGSAAERVSRESFNPTLLIGPHNETRLRDVDRVVVPCDGSQLSEVVLPVAREWADRLGLDLWVVSSLSPRDTKQSGHSSEAETNYVRRLAKTVDGQWEVLHGPDPAKAIVKWAGSALIAMTTHGRSGISRITVGSVTAGTTRWANGPVLVSNNRRHSA